MKVKYLVLALIVLVVLMGVAGKIQDNRQRALMNNLRLTVGDKAGRGAVVVGGDIDHHKQTGEVKYVIDGQSKGLEKIVGRFEEWQPVEGTADRLIILSDTSTGKRLTPFRIIFGGSSVTGKISTVRVIDLNKLESKIYADSIKIYDLVANLGEDEISRLIKKGDVVEVESNFDLGVPMVDGQGNPVGAYINIRRFGGVGALNQELK